MIYFVIIATGVAIWVTLLLSTACLIAKNTAAVARQAIQAGREDIARELFASLRRDLLGKAVCLFLPRDLKEKFLPPPRAR